MTFKQQFKDFYFDNKPFKLLNSERYMIYVVVGTVCMVIGVIIGTILASVGV